MIKIVLPDYPDKHSVKQEEMAEALSGEPASNCYYYTEITHTGDHRVGAAGDKDAKCWEHEVYTQLGPVRVRSPKLSKGLLSTADMLYELMLADNGDADAWVRTLLGNADAEGLWDRYHKEFDKK